MKKTVFISSLFLYLPFLLQAQVVNVSTSTQLQNALNTATPGQIITLADGVYIRSGGFYVSAGINGTSTQPITLKGNTNTIISSNNLSTGYGLGLRGNNYWVLDGFTVYNSKKGIVIDSSYFNTIKNITVNKIGDEGIHLRAYSSYNFVENCFVDSTGLVSTGSGEGIYIGSAVSNWPTYTAGHPDTCQNNTVTGNSFGDHVVSENIDIKEGTKNGIISFNTFNGSGLNGLNYADSWLDVKGNNYDVYCNTGAYTIADGFQTHINYTGYGNYNTFENNTLTVGSTGYGINITTSSSYGTATNNIVCSSNTVSGGAIGLSNVSTQTCAATNCSSTATQTGIGPSRTSYSLSPNPANDYLDLNALSITSITQYTIIDGLGKVKKTGVLSSSNTMIDISELLAGFYFLIVPGKEISSKFIKQ
jgi:hypothetical protein